MDDLQKHSRRGKGSMKYKKGQEAKAMKSPLESIYSLEHYPPLPAVARKVTQDDSTESEWEVAAEDNTPFPAVAQKVTQDDSTKSEWEVAANDNTALPAVARKVTQDDSTKSEWEVEAEDNTPLSVPTNDISRLALHPQGTSPSTSKQTPLMTNAIKNSADVKGSLLCDSQATDCSKNRQSRSATNESNTSFITGSPLSRDSDKSLEPFPDLPPDEELGFQPSISNMTSAMNLSGTNEQTAHHPTRYRFIAGNSPNAHMTCAQIQPKYQFLQGANPMNQTRGFPALNRYQQMPQGTNAQWNNYQGAGAMKNAQYSYHAHEPAFRNPDYSNGGYFDLSARFPGSVRPTALPPHQVYHNTKSPANLSLYANSSGYGERERQHPFSGSKAITLGRTYGNPYTNVSVRSVKKALNVDSPSFTPATLAVPNKVTSISQAVNAAPFTPRGMASGINTPNPQLDAEPVSFNPATITEFKPQGFSLTQGFASNGAIIEPPSTDPFAMASIAQVIPPAQYNPYLEDTSNMANNGAAFYQGQANYTAPAQPLQYHLYAPIGPHREDLLTYQKITHDFFIPEKIREELQKKNEASLQVMLNSQLPNLDPYHTLVALDTNHHKSIQAFGLPSWVYKATSSKNGNMYCLRRLEGYRLTNENAIKSVKDWRRVDNGSVVSIVDAFTTRAFGDSSLIFVTNYHPLSKTLVEHHFNNASRFGHRATVLIPEQTLWGYLVQLASAIKAVHAANLAVRCLEPSKIILTDKDRIRLSACSVLDVIHHEAQRDLGELQQEDLVHLGKLITILATTDLGAASALTAALDQIGRNYTSELRDTVVWLLTPAQAPAIKTVTELLNGISTHIVASFDSSLHAQDHQTSILSQELENGRLFRLVAKLGTINERAEYEGDKSWSETGDRYMLKLFRDFVFHQVDMEGRPVVDMAHILRCLNKLDAGIEERICLTSRDEQSCLVVTYRELKKEFASAWGDLIKAGGGGTGVRY